jgi:septum formation protein
MLVLASASPRRQELLRHAGIRFVVEAASIPEVARDGELPQDFAERMAREKAATVFRNRPKDFVLGADTVVVIDGVILGKPCDAAEAACMLHRLSGRTHEVITAVCLIGPNLRAGFRDTRSETTLVTMSELSHKDIRDYIGTEEPLDKAGAYGIQGVASRWIPHIEGDYFNVVGLPVALVLRMLHEHGVK